MTCFLATIVAAASSSRMNHAHTAATQRQQHSDAEGPAHADQRPIEPRRERRSAERHVGGEDAGHDRHAERHTDLALRREDRRCPPVLRWLDRRIARRLHRHEREAHAQPAAEHQAADQPQRGVQPECVYRAMVSAAARKPPVISRRGPMRAYSLPAISDEIMIPNACGNVVRPLASGCHAAK